MMKKMGKGTKNVLFGAALLGLLCIGSMARSSMFAFRDVTNVARSEVVETAEELREEGMAVKADIKDSMKEFKAAVRSFK